MRIPILFKTVLSFLLVLGFFACKKNSQQSKTDLLTSKTWVYDEYIVNFNTGNSTLAYKKGKMNNSIDLSLSQVAFKSDGTFIEIVADGSQHPGTWNFLNNETQYITHGFNYVATANVIILTSTRFVWYEQTADIYAELIPK
jgi:hypothetical protein